MHNIREQVRQYGVKVGLVGTALVAFTNQAMAALPAEATAAFTSMTTNVNDILAAIWPAVAAAVVGFKLIGLFKRGTNKI